MRPAAKKRFGQHFLRDSGILDRIVRLVRPGPEDVVVEIGAGRGALTTRLAEAAGRVLAVEIDEDCIELLRPSLEPLPSAVLCPGDILHMDVAALIAPYLTAGRNLRFVGNLPYNIATAIIDQLLDLDLPVHDMVFMVQLEVAERITAKPGTREYGYFSVYCGHRAEARIAFRVSPACFVPRPQVDSAVVVFNPKPRALDRAAEAEFKRLVKAAFAYRRKTVANSLRRDPEWGPVSAELLGCAGIDGSLRPESLSASDYERLAAEARRTMQNPTA
jgi:16S rRNA (adenine1518-N6/adenine1519-N6)-dimethyltransferase